MLPLLLVALHQEPHWFRAALEEAAALTAGSIWYWIDDRNIVDWDNPSIKQRFTGEAWRFDNNTFPINYVWHAVNGAGFHAIARSNGLGMAASLGYGFATSMAWEYALEFKEKVSINDVVVTPASGLVLGEFVYWLGAYFGYPGLGHEVADGYPRPEDVPKVAGAFEFAYAIGTTQEVRVAGDLTPADGLTTQLAIRVPFTTEGVGIDLFGDTLLWPHLALAYRYRYERLEGWHDRVAILHLPGLALDEDAGPVRVSARAHLDFAGLDAAAFVDDPMEVEKTVLERHGYYYGYGWSARLAVEGEYAPLSAGASFFYGQYQSIEGLDRNQEEVTSDVEAEDVVLDVDAWLRVSPYGPWFVQGRLAQESREGDVGGLHSDRTLRRWLVEVGATL